MKLQELAEKEEDLYRKVLDIYRQPQSTKNDKILHNIFAEYRKIHQTYSELSKFDLEALKRGLFIQWYALAEPHWLTGISELDEIAENRIIQALDELITTVKADAELTWMLNYYSSWNWIFERLASFKGFKSEIVNERNNQLPDKIDREKMAQRGQMGIYWNSLTIFSED